MVSPPRILAFLITLLLEPALTQQSFAQSSCEAIANLSLPATTISSATLVRRGPFTAAADWMGPVGPIELPEFCRVSGLIKPTTDSEIHFELWLPTATWNGKFLQVGNGGFAGVIVYRSMIGALLRGYATASTDDGHSGGSDVSWAIGHPEKVTDFAYRAVRGTAEISKTIIKFLWNHDPLFSYLSGCSGWEALIEAQRFPGDFDGIVIGAPANFWTHQFAGFVWNEQATLKDPDSSYGQKTRPGRFP